MSDAMSEEKDVPFSLLVALFVCSGASGLVYEVSWVRQFGNAVGNTVYSAAIVTAVFMLGLGIGSRFAGSWADRRLHRPDGARVLVTAYGAAEIVIALLGLTLAWILPRLGEVSGGASSYSTDALGWHELSFGASALRYLLATLLIAPSTFLMGATLTLLIRGTLLRDVKHAGSRIGILYGANTAGASLGALACDLALVPRLGVENTQLSAATVNLLVGLAALACARRISSGTPAAAEEKSQPIDVESAKARRVVLLACVALGLSGFAALGMEIVWFRFLSASLGAYREVFSILLGVILTGLWIGAFAAAFVQRRFGRSLELFTVAQALVALTAVLGIVFVKPEGFGWAATVTAGIAIVAVPALLMGFAFPVVNAHVQDALHAVGRRAGSMYFANTLGGVAGSLVAGLVFAPAIGSQLSFGICAACAALAPIPLHLAEGESDPRRRRFAALALVTAIACIGLMVGLEDDHLTRRFLPQLLKNDRAAILDVREGPNEIVAVIDHGAFGRSLVTNGHPMSATGIDVQRYMRAFAHLPLLMSERPDRALVICFGVGSTLHATSLHPSLTRIEIADLSRNVLSHAPFFRETNHDVLKDPRVAVFVADGRQHLRQAGPDAYDLVTLEPPPIRFAGVSALYSREFYELVKSRLKRDGFVTQWLPAYQTTPQTNLEMVRAFIDVFPTGVLLSGHASELILLGAKNGTPSVDLDAFDARLRARPLVAQDMTRIGLGTLTEIVGTFLADGSALGELTQSVKPVTDDRPSMEHTFGSASGPPTVFFQRLDRVARFCPRCFGAGGEPDPRVASLPSYLDILGQLYALESFRENRAVTLKPDPALIPVIDESPYLSRMIFGADGAAPIFRRAFQLAQAGNLEAARVAYERGLSMAPADYDARYNLAAILASLGREQEAVVEVEHVVAGEPQHARAKAMLCALRPARCP